MAINVSLSTGATVDIEIQFRQGLINLLSGSDFLITPDFWYYFKNADAFGEPIRALLNLDM